MIPTRLSRLIRTLSLTGTLALTSAYLTACLAPAQPQPQQIQQVIVVVTATPQTAQSASATLAPTVAPTALATAVLAPPSPIPPTVAPLPTATPEGGSVNLPAPTEVPPTVVPTAIPPTSAPTDIPTEVPPAGPTSTPVILVPVPTKVLLPSVTFTASDQSLIKSQCATLTWKATLMKSVEINGVNKPLVGSEQVCPTDSTNYTLVGTPKIGQTQVIKSISIKVSPLILTKVAIPLNPKVVVTLKPIIKPVWPKP